MEEDELYESLTPFLSPTPAPSDTIPGSLEIKERDNRGKETPRRVPEILLASPVEGGADVLTLGEPTAPPLVAPPPFWDMVDDDSFEDLGGDVSSTLSEYMMMKKDGGEAVRMVEDSELDVAVPRDTLYVSTPAPSGGMISNDNTGKLSQNIIVNPFCLVEKQ